jgi:hypothetical protein
MSVVLAKVVLLLGGFLITHWKAALMGVKQYRYVTPAQYLTIAECTHYAMRLMEYGVAYERARWKQNVVVGGLC